MRWATSCIQYQHDWWWAVLGGLEELEREWPLGTQAVEEKREAERQAEEQKERK